MSKIKDMIDACMMEDAKMVQAIVAKHKDKPPVDVRLGFLEARSQAMFMVLQHIAMELDAKEQSKTKVLLS